MRLLILDAVFKNVYYDPPSRNRVRLGDAPLDKATEAESSKLWSQMRTRAFVWAAQEAAGAPSPYALERFVTLKRGNDFHNDAQSRVFWRLKTRGAPSVDSVWSGPVQDVNWDVVWVLDNMPEVRGMLDHVVWELLKPVPPKTRWLNGVLRDHEHRCAQGASPEEPAEVIHQTLRGRMEQAEPHAALQAVVHALLELRWAEREGDLVRYIATLRACMDATLPPHGAILQVLAPSLKDYVARVFANVWLIARSEHALRMARGRLHRQGIAFVEQEGPEVSPFERAFGKRVLRTFCADIASPIC